ncbi:MAG: ATP-binding cassette domain-containing protein, partial [Ruminiclostridium sp.]|nr:ATP-binding cassette domain-containing protein [Ruminiclostridium sp.]
MKNILLSGKNVRKSFFQNGKETEILKSVTTDIFEGDFTVIMGASGAGKSTLLYALSGMDGITGGEVFFKGQKISGLSENKMAELRGKEFGFVFQQPHLVSNLTLFENVAAAGLAGRSGNVKEIGEKANRLLSQMNVNGA